MTLLISNLDFQVVNLDMGLGRSECVATLYYGGGLSPYRLWEFLGLVMRCR